MLTLKELKLAINDLIIAKFPAIEIQATDVREGFKRASFFVELVNLDRDTRQYVSERSVTVRVFYFPASRREYALEIMEVQDDLESVFNLNFKAAGKVITINETRGQTIDGVLEFEFDFMYHDKIEITDDSDLMQDLELRE